MSTPSDWWRWVRGKSDTPRRTTLHCVLPCPAEGAILRTPRHHRFHTPRSGRLVQMEELWNEKRRGLKFYWKWWTRLYIEASAEKFKIWKKLNAGKVIHQSMSNGKNFIKSFTTKQFLLSECRNLTVDLPRYKVKITFFILANGGWLVTAS